MQGRQKQQKHRERTLSLKRLRTAASPNVVFAEECNRVMAQCMETVALELHRTRHAAIKALGQVRNCVSQGDKLSPSTRADHKFQMIPSLYTPITEAGMQ